MTEPKELDLAKGILDHQVVDSAGRRCGKVDDLELEGSPGERLYVTALLVGPRYWRQRVRGPAGRLLARLGGGGGTKVPWDAVERVRSDVELSREAGEVGLGRGDDRARRYVDWIPGS